ncbi:MAG TPA: GNAT family N-acetyltransferase [Dehalococcoidia bacterium]|nr:GNAT family N-acetyltransferase [Dehalococcoidia bacterium]
MNITIRDYETKDYDICRLLWVELTQHHRDIYGDPTIGGDDPGREFDRYLENPQRKGSWIAEIEGKVIALAGLLTHSHPEEGDTRMGGEVEPVVVSQPYRDRGIGTRLVEHVVEQARRNGVRFLSIRPVARNERALSLYVRLGFDAVGEVALLQDLSSSYDRKWKPGIRILNNELRY